MNNKVSTGVVHKVPSDMKAVLLKAPKVLALWNGLTPLARNEWICWSTSVKKAETRAEHITRMSEQLQAGKRRPCCWPGCPHREKTGR